MTEDGGRMTDDGGRRTESLTVDRLPFTVDRGQMTDFADRLPLAENGSLRICTFAH
jgi:hypothetical protein